MIQATDLRINNLFRDSLTGELLQVKDLSYDKEGAIKFYVINREKFPLPEGWHAEPIPLTEEWLLKFHFDKFDEGSYSGIWMQDKTERCLSRGDEGYYYSDLNGQPYSRNIKYVHQIQNLFFALTGEELTIKQTA